MVGCLFPVLSQTMDSFRKACRDLPLRRSTHVLSQSADAFLKPCGAPHRRSTSDVIPSIVVGLPGSDGDFTKSMCQWLGTDAHCPAPRKRVRFAVLVSSRPGTADSAAESARPTTPRSVPLPPPTLPHIARLPIVAGRPEHAASATIPNMGTPRTLLDDLPEHPDTPSADRTALAGLQAVDFSPLLQHKRRQWLYGSREWAFDQMDEWLAEEEAARMLWLVGRGGTGKTVALAVWLDRVAAQHGAVAVACHFCDTPAHRRPAALLASLSAALCRHVPGYAAQLDTPAVRSALAAGAPAELVRTLFVEPLQRVAPPLRGPLLLCIDGLDALDAPEPHAAWLGLFAALPPWVRLVVTSRNDPDLRRALQTFEPGALELEGPLHRADLRAYLRATAERYVRGDLPAAALEALVEEEFPPLKGAMAGHLQELGRAEGPALDARLRYAAQCPTPGPGGPAGPAAVRAFPRQICRDAGVNPDEVEEFVAEQLRSSAADARARAVRLLDRKADGLFVYAALVAGLLEAEAEAGRVLDFAGIARLPRGVPDLYMTHFQKAFPEGVAGVCSGIPCLLPRTPRGAATPYIGLRSRALFSPRVGKRAEACALTCCPQTGLNTPGLQTPTASKLTASGWGADPPNSATVRVLFLFGAVLFSVHSATAAAELAAHSSPLFFLPTPFTPRAPNPPIDAWRIPSSKGEHTRTPGSTNWHTHSASWHPPSPTVGTRRYVVPHKCFFGT